IRVLPVARCGLYTLSHNASNIMELGKQEVVSITTARYCVQVRGAKDFNSVNTTVYVDVVVGTVWLQDRLGNLASMGKQRSWDNKVFRGRAQNYIVLVNLLS